MLGTVNSALRKFYKIAGGIKLGLIHVPVFLFPHSSIGEKDIKTLRMYLNNLTICQPWFLKTSTGLSESDKDSFIKVLDPPEDLKPRENFMALLSEYRQWIKNDYDKGYSAFFSTALETGLIEEKPWKIRQMIHRRLKQEPSVAINAQTLKWHLILHLEREFEDNREEAEDMLHKVNFHQPPLKDALADETPLKGVFDDLSTESLNLENKSQFRQIIEAWFGLFGGYIPQNGVLLTLDRHLMEYLDDIFDNNFVEFSGSEDEISLHDFLENKEVFTVKRILPIPNDVHSDLDSVRSSLSGRTIILLA